MLELKNEILINIDGGVNLSGSLVTAFTKAINSILGLGRSLGTAIRRINSGKLCPFN